MCSLGVLAIFFYIFFIIVDNDVSVPAVEQSDPVIYIQRERDYLS